MLRQLRVATVLQVQRGLARRLIYNGLVQKKTGLFGVDSLRTSKDFKRASENCMKTIDYMKLLLATKDLNPKQTLLLLDSISNELCRVIDVAELCRNIHEAEEFQAKAEESFASLSTYIHKLNSDKNVYLKLVHLMNNDKVWQHLSEEEKLFVIDLRGEFEADGIHLEGKEKQKSLDLQRLVVENETRYSQNSSGYDTEILLGPFPKDAHISHLRDWLENYVRQRTFRNSQAYLLSNADRRINDALMRSIDQEYIRRQLYTATLAEPSANIKAFGAIIKDRQALAKCLGFESYAHKILKNKVIRTPENVLALLQSVNEASQDQALAELGSLRQLKQTLSPSYSKEVCEAAAASVQDRTGGMMSKLFGSEPTASKGLATRPVEVSPWDVQYLCGILEHVSSSSSSESDISAEEQQEQQNEALTQLQEYLHIDTCLDGLKQVTHTLFGISVQECHMDEQERWTVGGMSSGNSAIGDDQQKNRKFLSDIKKFVVLDEDCEVLGTVYLDLFMRPNKFSGAAHFTVRCGCITLDTTSLQEVLDRGGDLETPAEGSEVKVEGVKQLPSIAIVFNFRKHDNNSEYDESDHTSGGTGRPVLMSLSNLETLYHEWGHALHSLLSKTQFQHLSGTRGGVDFVEVPSHLMEFFARSPEVIHTWARHYQTGEEVPVHLLQQGLRRKETMAALELQHQLLLSAMDQYIFGPALGDVSHLTPEQVFLKVVTDLVKVQKEYTVLPTAKMSPQDLKESSPFLHAHVKPNQEGLVELPALHLLNHTHLINYGGGYYSYLFAKMYAAQIWAKKFANNPLSRSSGQLLYKNMLIYGSGKEPRDLLRDIAEGPLDPNYYFKYVLNK